MKINNKILALFLAAILLAACSSGNKIGGSNKSCGCAAKKGMVGY